MMTLTQPIAWKNGNYPCTEATGHSVYLFVTANWSLCHGYLEKSR
ncbi:MAG: hypothetical protein ACXACI_17260 [Candidatus Hodarchaeales archaeon]